MCLDGSSLKPGVIIPFKRIHQSMEGIWPECVLYCHENGSQTAESWVSMFQRCFLEPLRARFPDESKPLLLICDSGGGSWMHVSISIAVLCKRFNAFVFVLPAHCTCALCPLDQSPHSVMSTRWSEFKQAWSRREKDMNIFVALAGIRRCVSEGLSEKNCKAGWARCGFVAGERIQRDIVLRDS